MRALPIEPRVLGSSPQVRGIFKLMVVPFKGVGIIPAGAGHLLAELEYRSKISLSNAILKVVTSDF